MSEEKINVKKSILSPDVAPFVPRNFNVNYYGFSNFHSEINETGFITNFSGIEFPQPSKWESPIIYPASLFHNAIYPFAHVIAPECSFHAPPIIDSKYYVSTFDTQFISNPNFQNKYHPPRKPKKYAEVSETSSNTNVQKRERKKRRSHRNKAQQISSDLSNFKVKGNQTEYKRIKSRTDNKEKPLKFDSNIEFPTLPSISDKIDSTNDTKQSSSTSFPSNSSYSSVLQFESKESTKADRGRNNNKLLNNENQLTADGKSAEKPLGRLVNGEKKDKNSSKAKNSSRNREHFQQGKNQKAASHQRNKNQMSESVKTVQKNPSAVEGSKNPSKQKNEKRSEGTTRSTETKGQEVPDKPEKSKRRRRNKKKKKPETGKVSLLSPEMFAAITKQFVKSSEYKCNNFNLSDAEEFPDLSNSVKNDELLNAHNDTLNKSTTLNTVIENHCDNSEVKNSEAPSDSARIDSSFSSILKMNNPPSKSVDHEDAGAEKLSDDLALQKEKSPSSKSKKLSKKKKKSKENATGTKSVKQPEKVTPRIELSITEMIASLQISKTSHKKKKDVKPRVISTKRGIMDKMLNPHNILDSSAPMKKRGKEREQPGKKRISAMRKVILRERERRKQKLEEIKFRNAEEAKYIDEDYGVLSDESKQYEEFIDDNIVCKPNINNIVENKTLQAAKVILHTRKFRDYCNHMLSEEIDTAVKSLLKDLIRFQDRLHQKDPVKARMKRRLVQGLREVTKHLRLSKLKCVVIAPDIEKISAEGGLNDALQVIINLATEQRTPCVFALQRRTLGKLCMKSVPVSCVGIFNYEGSEENFRLLNNLIEESKNEYVELLKNIQKHITEEIEEQVLQTAVSDSVIQTVRSSILRQLSAQDNFSQKNTIEESEAAEDSI